MRFGSTAKVLAECKPKSYRISECLAEVLSACCYPVDIISMHDMLVAW